MKEDLRPDTSPPPSAGLIRLQASLTGLNAWLAPAWAALCGVIASGGFGWQSEDWLRLGLLVLLVDGGWGTLWAALGGSDWVTPLRRWRSWRESESVTTLPYTLPGSPGNHASVWLGRLLAWWRDVLWPTNGPAITAIAAALPVTALVAVLLGPELLMLSAAALAMMQLGLAWESGRGVVPPGWDAFIAIGLPWLAGHVAFGSPTLRSSVLALLFALAWGNSWQVKAIGGRLLTVGSQLLAATLLVALHRPLMAGGLLLLLVPQVTLLPWLRADRTAEWYVRHARPWLIAAMLIAAWAV